MNKILIAAIIFGVIVIAVTLWQGNQYREFLADAQKATGRIIKKEERIADQKTRRKEYWVTYTYADDKGGSYTTQEQIEYPDIFMNLREGAREPVYYRKANPAESYLAVTIERRAGK